MKPADSVILVHGIWAHGVTMVMMKYRLQKEYGYDVHLFNYPSVKGTLAIRYDPQNGAAEGPVTLTTEVQTTGKVETRDHPPRRVTRIEKRSAQT